MIEKFCLVKFPSEILPTGTLLPRSLYSRKFLTGRLSLGWLVAKQISHKRLPAGELSSGRLSWDDCLLKAWCFFQIRFKNLPTVSKNLKYLKETVHTTFFSSCYYNLRLYIVIQQNFKGLVPNLHKVKNNGKCWECIFHKRMLFQNE